MQVPQRAAAATTCTSLFFQTLPSPASDQGTMVVLPSSPSSPRAVTPSDSTYSPIAHLSTPVTPANDEAGTLSCTPSKRSLKSHVTSACVNCKKAHLACDVSRPCKRCVSSGKADTCQDVKHKKRGRPRLSDTKRLNSIYGGAMILYEDDEEENGITRASVPTMQATRKIAFIHEPIESFREQKVLNRKKDLATHNLQMPREPEPPPSPPLLPLQQCSTTPPKQHLPVAEENIAMTTATIFLSMEMCCARVSDEVTGLWGYDPGDLTHRSLYGLISSHDTDRLGRLHRLLLDNIMEMACQHDSSFRPDMRPPPSERTTSPLFYETDPDQLCHIANGSNTFMDTLHIKKQSGEYELYEVFVYLGSGLGADLTRTSTLDRLYVVAELKKHQYKVKPGSTASLSLSRPKFQPSPSNSSSNEPSSSSSSYSLQNKTQRLLAPQFFRQGNRSSNNSNLLQVRHGSLPVHFAANCQLNTVSLPVARKSDAPKVNVAPITGEKKERKITDRLFPSLGNGPQFRRITTADPTTPPIHVNPYSSIAYRFAPIASGSTGLPRRAVQSITHPTTQYFLQTSSSTLNVAASAAQRNIQHTSSISLVTENVSKTDSNRKAEMSVRSLLC